MALDSGIVLNRYRLHWFEIFDQILQDRVLSRHRGLFQSKGLQFLFKGMIFRFFRLKFILEAV